MNAIAPLLVAGIVLTAALALGWWLFIQTEGVYLGPRVVRLLYDRSARAYDSIKEFDDESDDVHLGQPLAAIMAGDSGACMLDVGTGTARLPLSVFRHLDFKGRVVGLDSSREMLAVAAAKTVFFAESLDLVQGDGRTLPVASASCHTVTCIEAVEFFPDPRLALHEMVRVLRPAGTLLISNRRGVDRWTFPGRGYSLTAFERLLSALGLVQIRTQPWLTYYDLVWARKPAV